MKILLTLSIAILLSSCGKETTVITKNYQGKDGTSCSVTQYDTGLEVNCSDGTSSFVYNGVDGMPGEDGDDFSFEVIDPCNDTANIHDEVLLSFGNGLVIASFSDNASGKNTRFSILTEGTYQTTDGSNCVFSVDEFGNIYNEHY